MKLNTIIIVAGEPYSTFLEIFFKTYNSKLIKKYNKKLIIKFREKFLFRRGRINCSLNDTNGWRWFGIQFVIEEN